MLREVFGVTAAESKLAIQMVDGEGLQSVVDRLFLSITTIRDRLVRLLTGLHRAITDAPSLLSLAGHAANLSLRRIPKDTTLFRPDEGYLRLDVEAAIRQNNGGVACDPNPKTKAG